MTLDLVSLPFLNMSVQTQVVPKIEKIKDPRLPQFLFEWHPHTKKVYVVCLPGKFVDGIVGHFENGKFVPGFYEPSFSSVEAKGFVLAEHCEHHARFYGFVQTYARGYFQGFRDSLDKENTDGRKSSG